ncbi:hypothetical protein C8R45DRAFT_1098802 [Mycena sanguinolenta]|nr:hypothetical protein C8R45DRAFT_1098802 [Mycena sanguinolenta]
MTKPSYYILSQLQESVNRENCAIVKRVVFQLMISESLQPIPEPYLFLCSAADFQMGPSLFRWSDCSAYWSLDPSGTDCLTTEGVSGLGFPSSQMLTGIHAVPWDDSVYAGVRPFQQAKGFDPYLQDAARHLNHPPYRLFLLLIPVNEQQSFVKVDRD